MKRAPGWLNLCTNSQVAENVTHTKVFS